jgi:peptidyl-prolyl cis-trans isomerase A (cyclophilin A)
MNWKATARLALIFVCAMVLMSACSASDKAADTETAAKAQTPAAGETLAKAPAAGAKSPADISPTGDGSMEFESLDKVKERLDDGVYAVLDTSMGRIVAVLYPDKTPIATANFIDLAEGTKEWTDPKTREKVKKPFYDGLIFHRVIPNFMIQGGCPLGQGIGGPGYQFQNETHPDLKFDKPGVLAYANSGPGTNGSQFFITHAPTTWLNDKHPIFGQVIEGQSIVDMIGNVKTAPGDKPVTPVVLTKVSILRIGEAAQSTAPADSEE